jgi:hypothetical protein
VRLSQQRQTQRQPPLRVDDVLDGGDVVEHLAGVTAVCAVVVRQSPSDAREHLYRAVGV